MKCGWKRKKTRCRCTEHTFVKSKNSFLYHVLRSTFILQRCTHVYTSTNIIYNKILLQYPVLYIVHCLLPLYKFVKITVKTLYLLLYRVHRYHVPHNSRLKPGISKFSLLIFFLLLLPPPPSLRRTNPHTTLCFCLENSKKFL